MVAYNGFADTVSPEAAGSGMFWAWRLLGRLHPLAVHFPVCLILVAAILELFTLKNFSSPLRPGINVLVALGAITAAVSVVFGLLISRDGDYGKDLIDLHKWSGIATTALAAVAWLMLDRIKENKMKSFHRKINEKKKINERK